jgi:hypothetical protein
VQGWGLAELSLEVAMKEESNGGLGSPGKILWQDLLRTFVVLSS